MGYYIMIFICVWFLSTMAYGTITTIKGTTKGSKKKEVIYSCIFFAIVSFFCYSYLSNQNTKYEGVNNNLYEIEKAMQEISIKLDDSHFLEDELADINHYIEEIYSLINN